MLGDFSNDPMTAAWRRDCELIRKIYDQQLELHRKKSLRLSGKVLSSIQPYVKAIARGKAKGSFEFGAKMSLGVDEHGMTLGNRQYCRDQGLRLSAVALGRPLEDTEENRPLIRKLRKQLPEDNGYRQRIERKFGIGKRKYAWDCVKEKLAETSMTKIHPLSLVMNIDKILPDVVISLIASLNGSRGDLRSRASGSVAG